MSESFGHIDLLKIESEVVRAQVEQVLSLVKGNIQKMIQIDTKNASEGNMLAGSEADALRQESMKAVEDLIVSLFDVNSKNALNPETDNSRFLLAQLKDLSLSLSGWPRFRQIYEKK